MKKKSVLFAMCAIVLISGCKKDSKSDTKEDPYAPVEQKTETIVNKDSLKAVVDVANVVNMYDSTKVPTANEIQIMNADTTLLKINKTYFEKKAKFTPHKGMVMVLELDEYTLFNALVEDITDEGTYYTMKVSRAPLNKVFPELEVAVTSENAKETKADGKPSNALHPIKIVMDNGDGTRAILTPTKGGAGGKSYDISVSFDFGTGVDFGNSFKLELYRNGDLTDNAQLNLDLKVMTYIRYGKKLYEFKAGADLSSMLRLPLTVKFNQATEKRYTIFTKSFDKYCFSIWVSIGGIPFEFEVRPSINFNVGATLKGDCSTDQKAFHTAFFPMAEAKFLVAYSHDTGWSATHSSNFSWDMDMPRMGENAKISLDAGIYPQVMFGVDYVDFVQGRIGPALVATASTGDKFHNSEYNVDATTLDGRLSLDTKAYYWAGAGICGYKIAGWSQWFTLSSTTLWEDKREVDFY